MLADVLVVAGAIGLAGFLGWFFFGKPAALRLVRRQRDAGARRARAAMRSVLIRLCLVAVYVLENGRSGNHPCWGRMQYAAAPSLSHGAERHDYTT